MTLEQWEIELRNQLSNIQESNQAKVDEVVEKEVSLDSKASNDWLLYASMFVFLILSILYMIDLKTGFIDNAFRKQEIKEELDVSPSASYSADELEKIKEKVQSQEKKLFLLGLVTNENAYIVKQNKNKKDMMFIEKNWTVDKGPTYIHVTDKDIEYLEKLKTK